MKTKTATVYQLSEEDKKIIHAFWDWLYPIAYPQSVDAKERESRDRQNIALNDALRHSCGLTVEEIHEAVDNILDGEFVIEPITNEEGE